MNKEQLFTKHSKDIDDYFYLYCYNEKDVIICFYEIVRNKSKLYHSIFYSCVNNRILKPRNLYPQRKDFE